MSDLERELARRRPRHLTEVAPGPQGARSASSSAMDRFIDAIEWLAAAFVGIVAADIFVSVLLRYFFSRLDPRQLRFRQAAAGHSDLLGHRGDQLSRHAISPSIWYGRRSGPRGKRLIDVFATLVLLFVVTVQTTMLFDKVRLT